MLIQDKGGSDKGRIKQTKETSANHKVFNQYLYLFQPQLAWLGVHQTKLIQFWPHQRSSFPC